MKQRVKANESFLIFYTRTIYLSLSIEWCIEIDKEAFSLKECIFSRQNESISIQLQFATNSIKFGPLEPEIQRAKVGALRHYAGPLTSRDVKGLPPVTISLVTLYNCFLTVEDYTKDTQEISCGQLPNRRRERTQRRMFVIYSSAHQLCFIANYHRTWHCLGYITKTSTFTNRFSRFMDQCEGENPSYSSWWPKFLKLISKRFFGGFYIFLFNLFKKKQ